jgi:hypothetical protein
MRCTTEAYMANLRENRGSQAITEEKEEQMPDGGLGSQRMGRTSVALNFNGSASSTTNFG